MIVSNRFALAAASAILSCFLAGCAGQTSSAVPYATPGLAAFDGDQLGRAGGRAYLYVSDAGAGDVQIFSWPNPSKPIATLTGFGEPQGLCNDGKNVYIVDFAKAAIVEYAAGATSPLRTIHDRGALPVACSYDPTTGDLAVANLLSKSYGPGSIVIYHKAKGKPQHITPGHIYSPFSIQYDGSGNLFVTGQATPHTIEFTLFVERPAGSKHFKVCSPFSSSGAGGLGWDGTYIALGVANHSQRSVYQMKGCTAMGFTPLDGASDIAQFYIDGNRLVSADAGNLNVATYAYPGGGSPISSFGGLSEPSGVTIVPTK
jgi:hypothetical protein